MIGGTISLPFILTPALCIEEDDPARSYIVSTIIFVSGIVTLLQCTVGVRYWYPFILCCISLLTCFHSLEYRLPIVQGGTFSFLVPTFVILNLPQVSAVLPLIEIFLLPLDFYTQWQCPSPEVMANLTYEDKTEVWQMRMREIQGAIIVSAVFQVLIGFLGCVSWKTN